MIPAPCKCFLKLVISDRCNKIFFFRLSSFLFIFNGVDQAPLWHIHVESSSCTSSEMHIDSYYHKHQVYPDDNISFQMRGAFLIIRCHLMNLWPRRWWVSWSSTLKKKQPKRQIKPPMDERERMRQDNSVQ